MKRELETGLYPNKSELPSLRMSEEGKPLWGKYEIH
jgi:hypothetical protein